MKKLFEKEKFYICGHVSRKSEKSLQFSGLVTWRLSGEKSYSFLCVEHGSLHQKTSPFFFGLFEIIFNISRMIPTRLGSHVIAYEH
jgi:hypothetical protein